MIATRSAPSYSAIRRHATWLLAAFFLVLSFFVARNLVEVGRERQEAVRAQQWAQASATVGVAAHALQKERGMSSGFIASAGQGFVRDLRDQRRRTENAVIAVEEAVRTLAGERDPLRQNAVTVLLGQITELRRKVDTLGVSREFVVAGYTEVIDRLFDLQLYATGAGREGEVFRRQMAYFALVQAKEMAGLERALLSAMLSDGNFSAGRMAVFHRLKAKEAERINDFLRLADEASARHYREAEGSRYVVEADRIRRKVLAAGLAVDSPAVRPAMLRDSDRSPAEYWFYVATQRIDTLQGLEDRLGAAVMADAAGIAARTEREFAVTGLSALASFGLAGMLLFQVYRGKRLAEEKLSLGDAVFSHSVEAIAIADAEPKFIDVNEAFCRITGYSRDEAIGNHPRLLKSGRHDRLFYEAMWGRLLATGSWEGEIWNRRKNGDIYPALLSIVAVKNDKAEITHYIAMTVDLSQHKQTEALLEQLRTFDPLTGLPNRQAWLVAIDQAVARARDDGQSFAVLEIGLDRFKLINDSLGHLVGDRVLTEAGERITEVLRRHDVAARPGGDRFSLLLPDLHHAKDIGAVCEKLLVAFVQPIRVQDHLLHLTISIGIATFPDDGADAINLIKNAEAAMFAAKEAGRSQYKYYDAEMNTRGAQILVLERMLRQALERGEFSVHYQPQVSARGGRLVGVEALLRWNSPELGEVSPVQFIPIAEETGLIEPIDEWVLRQAALQAVAWRRQFGRAIRVAVNLSARQFRRQDLLVSIRSILDETGLPSEQLELELTEGLLMADPAGAADIMRGLREMGARIALDDFGTGYSSLAYLKNFPIDVLKIDRAFVRDLPDNLSDQAIARTVIALADNLGMAVLAEGVETEAQRDFLVASGCGVLQGYLTGRPMPGRQIKDAIESGALRLI